MSRRAYRLEQNAVACLLAAAGLWWAAVITAAWLGEQVEKALEWADA